eukprot:TRINITY_DN155_c0_g1_i4.p1 TRINITY_DN155_c0_g1~~TRINITY_DN155_c0_g1_i4.p1  ORF type:complete len:147 (-),score=21.35 TRINITY_DN155_c0_g1_i4:198-638(-)
MRSMVKSGLAVSFLNMSSIFCWGVSRKMSRKQWYQRRVREVTSVLIRYYPMSKKNKKPSYIGIIADEDTVTGFLLAGIGESDVQNGENFLVVSNKTPQQKIEDMFRKLTARPDLTILLISQQVWDFVNLFLPFPGSERDKTLVGRL